MKTMKSTITIGKFPPAVGQLLIHFGAVFLLAFGTQLVAGATNVMSFPTLLALLTSAAAAGIVAVSHILLGLIPTQNTGGLTTPYNALGVSLKVKSAVFQIVISVVVTFVTILGTSLVTGATHITSFPDTLAVVLAAISAAVFGVVQYLSGLVPAPKS